MPLQSGDIRIARSAQMNDTIAGGGPPSAQLLPDGASNAIVPDISEDARVGGLVEIRHLHGVLRNTDTDALTGANIILAEPPDDPHVSITLVGTRNTFARRPDIVRLIEATSTPGPEYPGFLLENHVAAQRSIQIGQRPGAEPPGVNTTLVLVHDEGLPTEVAQYVRVRRVTVAEQTFSEATGSGSYVDYPIQIATCELYSPLTRDFAGSSANRLYARQAGKARLRRATVTDAGSFCGAARLTQACQAQDIELKLASIHTQLVPNTRTETPLTDQRPGGVQTVRLTDSQGVLEVPAAGHTDRIMVSEATRGYSYTFQLKPTPAPGTVAVSYLVMGTWYTLQDDGAGQLSGSGGGTVSYHGGAVAVTLQALPDLGSPVIISWADTAPYVNACAAGPIVRTQQPPEFALAVPPGGVPDGSTLTWPSGGQTRTATINAAGQLAGDASGRFVAATGHLYVRPAHWPDAGAAFSLQFATRPTVTQSFASVSVDAGGFAQLTLDEEPIPGSLVIEWYTAQTVSRSSGANLAGTASGEASSSHHINGIDSNPAIVRATTTGGSHSTKTESSSSHRRVLRHTASDDGAGHFAGDDMGSVNYSGRTVSLRMVTQGASASSYQSEHESAQGWHDSLRWPHLPGGAASAPGP